MSRTLCVYHSPSLHNASQMTIETMIFSLRGMFLLHTPNIYIF